MKKIFTICCCLFITAYFNSAFAQTADSVSIGAGYVNQVHYSLQNGAFPAVDNTNWELGFQIRGFAASIIINSKNNVHLYRSAKSAADWNTMTASDTTGYINSTYELNNSDESWDEGAFNQTIDTSNAFDLGWGVYDFVTHIVQGDSAYFIQLPSGTYKKLLIESLTTGVYYFRWADLDGSNEVMASLSKSNFSGKYFGYYSIVNNTWIDREPIYNAWDLVFHQYLAVHPFIYKVVGVLSNDSVFAAKAYPVDVNTVSASSYTLDSKINVINYDWKTYDFNNNVYVVEDSLAYFVKDRSNGLWKIIFTGFGGSSNGNYYFTKEYLGVAGVDENGSKLNNILSVYPNPATSSIHIMLAKENKDAVINIFNASGQIVTSFEKQIYDAISSVDIDVSAFAKGLYFLSVRQGDTIDSKSFVVQ
jgi:hypothetical protein